MLYTLWQPDQRTFQEQQQQKNESTRGITNSLNIQAMPAVMATVIGGGIIVAILHGWSFNGNMQTINCTNTTTYYIVRTDITEPSLSSADLFS